VPLKQIKNNYIRDMLERDLPDNIDGELMDIRGWEYTQSSVMTEDGEPDFKLFCFRYCNRQTFQVLQRTHERP